MGDAKASKSATRGKKLKGHEVIERLIFNHDSKWFVPYELLSCSLLMYSTASSWTNLTTSLLPHNPSWLRCQTPLLEASSDRHRKYPYTEPSSSSIVASRSVQTLRFAPHTPSQLLQILQTHLRPLYNVDPPPREVITGSRSPSHGASLAILWGSGRHRSDLS